LRALIFTVATVVLSLALAAPTNAAFPGQNGKIAFRDLGPAGLYTVEPDGTGRTSLGTGGDPAWAPDGSKIAFADTGSGAGDVFVMNGNGTGRSPLTSNPAADSTPAWSPDAASIAFVSNRDPTEDPCLDNAGDLYRMSAAGESGGVTRLTHNDEYEMVPRWSPDGSKIAFVRMVIANQDQSCELLLISQDLWVMNADGTGQQKLVDGGVEDLDWSPDGSTIVFSLIGGAGGYYDLWTIKPDGTAMTRLTTTSTGDSFTEVHPVWSPDGSKIAFESFQDLWVMNSDGSSRTHLVDTSMQETLPDWQPLPDNTVSTYARPKGATPMYLSLVPAYNPCTASNRTHGPPLAYASCNPPAPGSSNLTVGVGDGSPALARSVGAVRLNVLGMPAPPEDSDVRIRFSLTNVMKASDLSEYTGELRGTLTVRRTDREPGFISSTTQDFPFSFTVPCSPTPGSSLDASTCELDTTVDAVLPGTINDAQRTIWALDKLRVYDGGPDGDADTEVNNSLFMTQGVFVP
jgi:TolB protein